MHTNNIIVEPAVAGDLPLVYWLFEKAIAYQKESGFIGWQTYDKDYLKGDVEKKLLYKVGKGLDLVCIFCVCYTDALIWRQKEKGDAVYLHRVVVHPEHRGGRHFEKVLFWAAAHTRQQKRKYVRIDTWANNAKLIQYYAGYGFQFLEDYTTPDDPKLPDQHRNLKVALLQYTV